jgi:uncharacterized ferritin-like protein (DUF455 family)
METGSFRNSRSQPTHEMYPTGIVMDVRVENELRDAARRCIEECDVDLKAARTFEVAEAWAGGRLVLDADAELDGVGEESKPGLPPGLVLTSPTRVSRRGFGTNAKLAAFVHAIAHIEWNAINLAWDAVWRFGGMPREFYDDWARVASEEARHFAMLRARLLELDSDYGRLPAHEGLWQTAEATRHDLLARMALVPRVLEARGLDVTPGLIDKLRTAGDEKTAAILEVVLREEVGHVRIGSHWFHRLCDERGLEPAEAFSDAIRRYFRGRTKAVADATSRRLRLEAGFREDELDALARLARPEPEESLVVGRSAVYDARSGSAEGADGGEVCVDAAPRPAGPVRKR